MFFLLSCDWSGEHQRLWLTDRQVLTSLGLWKDLQGCKIHKKHLDPQCANITCIQVHTALTLSALTSSPAVPAVAGRYTFKHMLKSNQDLRHTHTHTRSSGQFNSAVFSSFNLIGLSELLSPFCPCYTISLFLSHSFIQSLTTGFPPPLWWGCYNISE